MQKKNEKDARKTIHFMIAEVLRGIFLLRVIGRKKQLSRYCTKMNELPEGGQVLSGCRWKTSPQDPGRSPATRSQWDGGDVLPRSLPP